MVFPLFPRSLLVDFGRFCPLELDILISNTLWIMLISSSYYFKNISDSTMQVLVIFQWNYLGLVVTLSRRQVKQEGNRNRTAGE